MEYEKKSYTERQINNTVYLRNEVLITQKICCIYSAVFRPLC